MFEAFHIGEDSAEYFTKLLLSKEVKFKRYIDRNMKLQMTETDNRVFKLSTHCEECGKLFDDRVRKCRDHDHFTGKYRAALCNFCNLQKKNPLFIPLYCHNLSGFDSHLIVKALKIDKSRFTTLSRNDEKIITMQIGMFKLIDSSSFMPESLEELAKFLKEKGESKFVQTKELAEHNQAKLDILLGKGIFPYEYITNQQKLDDTCLPVKEAFYSVLKETHITEAEYEKALDVWKMFDCKTLGDYIKLYCRSDVHLLADIWNNFCIETSTHLKIHPEAGYITLPSYAFDCFKYKLYKENGKLMEVIDEDMKMFHKDISKGIRGGSCMIKQKTAFDTVMENTLIKQANEEEMEEYMEIQNILKKKANNRSVKLKGMNIEEFKQCDEHNCYELVPITDKNCKQHSIRTIIAFDFNNLYGHSMTSKMPLNNFEKMSGEDLAKNQSMFDDISQKRNIGTHYHKDSDIGFIFCAQLNFPKESQERLLSFPLVPEQLIVEEEMISPLQKKTWTNLFSQPYTSSNHKKMVNSFAEKREYTSHYQLLSFLAMLGVKVKLLRGYSFYQEKFISSYVLFCAEQRKMSNNNADKKLWKNMANIIYGKFIGK